MLVALHVETNETTFLTEHIISNGVLSSHYRCYEMHEHRELTKTQRWDYPELIEGLPEKVVRLVVVKF